MKQNTQKRAAQSDRDAINAAFAELKAMPQFIEQYTGFDEGFGRVRLVNAITGMAVANSSGDPCLHVKWHNGSWELSENSLTISDEESLAKFMRCMRAQARGIDPTGA